MSSVKYFAPGVDKTEFNKILIVGRSDVGVLTSYREVILYPPTASLVLLGSDMCGLYATTILPQDRIKDITYGRIVVVYKPHKADPNRTRLTVGGDRITCLYDVSTPTSDLPTIKILWNSVLSTPGAKYFTPDISIST